MKPQTVIFEDPQAGTVVMTRRRGCTRMRLYVKGDGSVHLSVPYLCPMSRAELFFSDNRDWVIRAREKALLRSSGAGESRANSDIAGMDAVQLAEYVEKLRCEAKAFLPVRLGELRAVATGITGLDFSYARVSIKHNSSNWGSCSRRGNINLNLNLMRPTVPAELRDYVLLHELCHLRVPDHSPRFHALLETVCPSHRALGRRLGQYRLI